MPCPPERAVGCSDGGSAEGGRSAWRERGAPHGLWLDDREQLDDPWAQDVRGLVPTDGIQRKPHWQWERDRHHTPHVTHLEALEAPHERSGQTVPEAKVAALARELLQQGLGLLQVGGVKALGEPAIDRGQQVMRLLALTLLLPQPAQAHGGP